MEVTWIIKFYLSLLVTRLIIILLPLNYHILGLLKKFLINSLVILNYCARWLWSTISLTIVKFAFGGVQLLDNGGEGSAASTAATPTAPRGVTLRAVRQIVTVLQERKKLEERWQWKDVDFYHFPRFYRETSCPRADNDLASDGIGQGNEGKVERDCGRIVIFRKDYRIETKRNWSGIKPRSIVLSWKI